MRNIGTFVVWSLLAILLLVFRPAEGQPAQEVRKASKAAGTPAGTAQAAAAAEPGEVSTPQSEMRGLMERYAADRGSLNRSYPVDISPRRREGMRQFYAEWLGRLQRLDFDSMSQEGRLDYLLLKNHAAQQLWQLERQEKMQSEIAALVPFAETIIGLEEARRWMQPLDAAKAAATLARMEKDLGEIRKKLEAALKAEGKAESASAGGKLKKAAANRAAVATNDLRNVLKNWFNFYNGYDPVLTWWAGEPYKAADKALEGYAAFLREKVVGLKPGDTDAIVGDPIGRDAVLRELAYEWIPYTPEELMAIANREFAWCEAEMKRAARDLGHGDDWRKALEHVKTLYVPPGKQPELIRDLALEAIEFVEKRGLLTIPKLARETWRMQMMSPERQRVNPFFTGGEVISVSYPTSAMPHEQKLMSMRGNNIHFSRATVFHELIPGHHLQNFMAVRYRPYRNLFLTPFSEEGWALYWEMLLWDLNFARSPEDRIGMLFWRMHRCARIIFSMGFHLEKMTPEECIDFLVNRVGHERENATAEVRRSFATSYGPLYQAAYMLGGLQIRALHRELVGSGKMTSRAFHDAFLRENRIPIELLRASLAGQKLTRESSSNWKFYGPNPEGRPANE